MRSASAQSKMADIHYLKNKLGDRVIKQLPNSVIAKYLDLCLADQLFASTDKSQYFAELRSMNCQKSDKDNDINDTHYYPYYTSKKTEVWDLVNYKRC